MQCDTLKRITVWLRVEQTCLVQRAVGNKIQELGELQLQIVSGLRRCRCLRMRMEGCGVGGRWCIKYENAF